jgi:hypothetical protein
MQSVVDFFLSEAGVEAIQKNIDEAGRRVGGARSGRGGGKGGWTKAARDKAAASRKARKKVSPAQKVHDTLYKKLSTLKGPTRDRVLGDHPNAKSFLKSLSHPDKVSLLADLGGASSKKQKKPSSFNKDPQYSQLAKMSKDSIKRAAQGHSYVANNVSSQIARGSRTGKGHRTGTTADHKHAASLHHKAASYSDAGGLPLKAKDHWRQYDKHMKAAGEEP